MMRILCLFGFHDWHPTGIRNEFESMTYQCLRCNLTRSLKPANWSLPGWFYSRKETKLRMSEK